jgi:hypothetical protein
VPVISGFEHDARRFVGREAARIAIAVDRIEGGQGQLCFAGSPPQPGGQDAIVVRAGKARLRSGLG